MRKSKLKEEYTDENTFWHITSRLNIESIKEHGLVPRDGQRNGESKSAEDPVPRVFFSQGLEGVLGQANNLAFLVNGWIENIKITSIGDNGKDTKKKVQEFLDNSVNNKIEENDTKNGGFIDIANFIRKDLFKNGIDENLTKQDFDKIIYDIVKTIWENDVCLKVNLVEGIDYSWNDVNYNAKGTKKVPMTKKNMHAFEGRTITPDKIEIITDENGNPRTTWDVFKEMTMFYRREHPDKEYLPVEEWQSGFVDENGEIVYTGEINHRKDYLSMFIEIENLEQLHIKSTQQVPNKQKEEQTINIGEVKKGILDSKIATREGQSQQTDIQARQKAMAVWNRSRQGEVSQEERRMAEENERQVNETIVRYRNMEDKKEDKENELEQEEVRIKEKGINGLGENVDRIIKNGKLREKEIGHSGGSERERGGR